MNSNEEFTCIYCRQSKPEVAPSISDIIPTFLGGSLKLNNAVCKECNGNFNKTIEQPIRDDFSYLRSGLNLGGRRKREVTVKARAHILGKAINIGLRGKLEIPPFESIGPDGQKILVITGESAYVEKKKKEIESSTSKTWKWNEFSNLPKPEIFIKIFPFDILMNEKGQRFAAKIAFERLCQIKSPLIVNHNNYDNIRDFIINGKISGVYSNLFYDKKIMENNFNVPFPYHGIFLMQRNQSLVSIVSILGLFYFLVVLSNRVPIVANWEECIFLHSQIKNEYSPVLKGNSYPTIPKRTFKFDNQDFQNASAYALEKFKTALKEYAIIISVGEQTKKISGAL